MRCFCVVFEETSACECEYNNRMHFSPLQSVTVTEQVEPDIIKHAHES